MLWNVVKCRVTGLLLIREYLIDIILNCEEIVLDKVKSNITMIKNYFIPPYVKNFNDIIYDNIPYSISSLKINLYCKYATYDAVALLITQFIVY